MRELERMQKAERTNMSVNS